MSKKWIFIWVPLVFIIAAFLSQQDSDAGFNGQGWSPVDDIPPGTIIKSEHISEREVVIRNDESDNLVKKKEDIVGKVALYGIKKGYGITANNLYEPDVRYHEISIPIELSTSARPEKLKKAMIWIDYDQKRFPGKQPEPITEAVVLDLINRHGISIFSDKTNQKVPVSASLYIQNKKVAIVKAKESLGELFLTNPYLLVDEEEGELNE